MATFDSHAATIGAGAAGIEKYLASGQTRGIDPAMAKRIVALFGDATFDIIEAEPDRLKEFARIGSKRAERIDSGSGGSIRCQRCFNE